MNSHLQNVWQQCLADIKKDLGSGADYSRWFQPIVPVHLEGQKLTLRLPSRLFFEKMENVFNNELKASLIKNIGNDFELQYEIIENVPLEKYATPTVNIQSYGPNNNVKISNNSKHKQRGFSSNLESRLTFDNFVNGDSNQMVYNAAQAIIENPGTTLFNPLFIYGASGVGKTHMLHAIGNAILKAYPEKRVVYVSAQVFKMQYVESAYKRRKPEDFIQFYQNMDILLMDDIQELREAVSTQSAFFQIFNNLRALGKHIILTSDRPPVDLHGLEERLYTRMKWGLTAEIERPDKDLRKKVLSSMLKTYNFSLPKEIQKLIVDNTSQNIRDLEGVVKTIYAHHVLGKAPVTMDLAVEILRQHVKYEQQEVSLKDIVKEVCDYYHIESKLLKEKTRRRPVVLARQIAMYLCKELTDLSLSTIGEDIGNLNHSTVSYACKSIDDQLEHDLKLAKDVESIRSKILG